MVDIFVAAQLPDTMESSCVRIQAIDILLLVSLRSPRVKRGRS